MPVVINPDTPKLYVGTTEVLKAYWGSTLVWEPPFDGPSAQFVWAGGNEDLSELATTCLAGDFIIVTDTRNSSSAVSTLSGYTSRIYRNSIAPGANVLTCRLMTKFAASDNESVPAATGNRRCVAIYRNVDVTTPLHDIQDLTSGSTTGNPLVIPSLTLSENKMIVHGGRVRGSPIFPGSSLNMRNKQPPVTDGSWNFIADSDDPIASYSGENLELGSTYAWWGWSLALNAAA